jgi:hypothetical protein
MHHLQRSGLEAISPGIGLAALCNLIGLSGDVSLPQPRQSVYLVAPTALPRLLADGPHRGSPMFADFAADAADVSGFVAAGGKRHPMDAGGATVSVRLDKQLSLEDVVKAVRAAASELAEESLQGLNPQTEKLGSAGSARAKNYLLAIVCMQARHCAQ